MICPLCSEVVPESHTCRRLGGCTVILQDHWGVREYVRPVPPEGYKIVNDPS